jgi:short subunit dehydrogenase-like uncharacterized protein
MTKPLTWMIYGAYGYSGKLLTLAAKGKGLMPIIAGRNKASLNELALQTGFEQRCFDLTNVSDVASQLADVDVVFHCAGPFSATSQPMINACLKAKTHYFDITGEIDVFEYAHSKAINKQAKAAGIIVCPGIGFDVVPTDCLAKALSQAMPDATSLTLAFASGGSSLSPGTAKTSVEAMKQGTRVRRSGKIIETAPQAKRIDFGKGERFAMSLSWGDVSTAYYSTGIDNIDVFIKANKQAFNRIKLAGWLRPLLSINWVQNYLKSQIDKKVRGPSEARRQQSQSLIWGEVKNTQGEVKQGRLIVANGYDVTVYAPLAVVAKFLNSEIGQSGSLTPSMLFGADFVTKLTGSSAIEIFSPEK